ncbi:carboxylesterase, type B [gamma proteobacterium HTCC2207]|uniref:Carboxylic ester hydrolase n=1 Tax=gamma proteobacterium HTCC2207 TaxID=314287 RepID=Q1YT31_9GAMM|nr:carboxylesterase, type B [gamma proteobacterium HTCC2207]
MKLILTITSFLLLAACGLFSPEQPISESLPQYKIQTASGITQGRLDASADKQVGAAVVSWFDIPYAQAPVGDLRWRAPRALIAPQQMIAEREDTACVQQTSSYAGVEGGAEGVIGSEDCLFLDIRAPKDFIGKNYPVMLWIHGGSNTTGLKDYYDYSKLAAAKGVVVVAINYRLGALGWFTHPAIQGQQSGEDQASNFGHLDIIHSLKWVRDNIAGFGGDAANVTVFGESAGAHNVYALLASPLAKGLFHRAIAQSGYTGTSSLASAYNLDGTDTFVTRGAWQITQKLLAQQGTDESDITDEALRERLKSSDAREFIALYNDKPDTVDYSPLTTADGIVIPAVGMAEALADPQYGKNVPVISGANKDEVTLWFALHRYFMETSYPFTKLLPPKVSIKDPQLYNFWVRTRSQAWKARGVDEPLSAMEQAGYKALYNYRFDWDDQEKSFFIDFPSIFGAAHGTDISFITGDFKYGPVTAYIYPEGDSRDQMERTFMNIWGDFAHSGVPDKSLDFEWQRYNSKTKPYVRLDRDEHLGLQFETETLDTLLAGIAADSNASHIEKCLLVWETLINIGNADVARYQSWNNGQCEKLNARAEQERIAVELIEEFGTASVL